tara:strand:- start:7385 stop:7603 length:219 start_codon:yes stop_codon:yes gene_type:complete
LSVVEASVSTSVVSVTAIVTSALAIVEASISASVVSRPSVVAPVLTSILPLFGGLFLGSNGHRDADQGVHVE